MFEQLTEKINKLLGKEEEFQLRSVAYIDWHPNAEKWGLRGNSFKRIWYLKEGEQHYDIMQYTPEMMEILQMRNVLYYDSTLGLDEPLSMLRPTDIHFLKLGTLKAPIGGIVARR